MPTNAYASRDLRDQVFEPAHRQPAPPSQMHGTPSDPGATARSPGLAHDPVSRMVLDACRRIMETDTGEHHERELLLQLCLASQQREEALRQTVDSLVRLLSGAEGASLDTRADSPLHRHQETPIGTLPTGHATPERSAERLPPRDSPAQATEDCTAAPLCVYLLRPFSVFHGDVAITDWPNGKSRSIFKYLVLHRERPVPREVLMDTFWPDSDEDSARNNLNTAIYGLRKVLRFGQIAASCILFGNSAYQISPDVDIRVDAEDFQQHAQSGFELEARGKREAAVEQYRAAAALYHGGLLVEDRYDSWLNDARQYFHKTFTRLLDHLSRFYFDTGQYALCVATCEQALAEEPCNEAAQRMLMRCHAQSGQPHLALRQFHICLAALEKEGLSLSIETAELMRRIRGHDLGG
ncbi:MAG: winged helix-turn-helix domain-containing protein [Betaproteobacteria bacterium]|nr:winged helix-turn-helix domain-containing protein [Betaproteobacteria bacterium]